MIFEQKSCEQYPSGYSPSSIHAPNLVLPEPFAPVITTDELTGKSKASFEFPLLGRLMKLTTRSSVLVISVIRLIRCFPQATMLPLPLSVDNPKVARYFSSRSRFLQIVYVQNNG